MGFTWLAIGDSITYGKAATNDNGYINLTRLFLKANSKNHFLVNQGIPSITSTQYLNRYKSNIKAIDADLITIALGTNDTALTPAQYKTNISQLIDLIRQNAVESTPKIVLFNIIFRNDASDSLMQQFNTELTSLSTSKNVPLINIRRAFSTSASLGDVVHPNDSGHQQIANVLGPDLIALL